MDFIVKVVGFLQVPAASKSAVRMEIDCLYAEHQPEKLVEVDSLIEKYLLRSICTPNLDPESRGKCGSDYVYIFPGAGTAMISCSKWCGRSTELLVTHHLKYILNAFKYILNAFKMHFKCNVHQF